MLSNTKISVKILVLIFLPVILALVLGILEIRIQYDLKANSENTIELVGLTIKITELVHELQSERGMNAGYITSKGRNFADKLTEKNTTTDEVKENLLNYYNKVKAHLNENEIITIEESFRILSKLGEIRQKVWDSTHKNSISAVEAGAYYTNLIKSFLRIIPEIIKDTKNVEVIKNLTALDFFVISKGYAGQERAILNVAFTDDFLKGKARLKFYKSLYAQDHYLSIFKGFAPREILDDFHEAMEHESVLKVQELRNLILEQEDSYSIDPMNWFRFSTDRIEVLKI